MELLLIIKDSRFEEADPFIKIFQSYIAAIPIVDLNIIHKVEEQLSGFPNSIQTKHYNDWINWLKCMPMIGNCSGNGGHGPCHNQAECQHNDHDFLNCSCPDGYCGRTCLYREEEGECTDCNHNDKYCNWERKMHYLRKEIIASLP